MSMLEWPMAAVWMFASAAAGSARTPLDTPLDTLAVYAGSWTVAPRAQGGEAAAKPDRLVNHCHMDDAFYTCEQVVNGKPAALLVFTAGEKAGEFHSQVVLPDGNPAGRRGDLTISGEHWTYLNKDEGGKPMFRVENYFTGRDHIHYEQWKVGPDGGPDGGWTKVSEGDEVRTGA